MKISSLNYLLIVFFILNQIACSGSDQALPPTSSSSSSTASTDVTGVDPTSILYIKLSSRWESAKDTDPFENWGNCSITPTSSGPSLTCQLSIPEQQMFYSSIKFTVGTFKASECPVISFRPYYYKRSEVNGYVPPGSSTALDCSKTTGIDKQCYGGAGPTLITDFPDSKGQYFFPDVNANSDFILKSENSLRIYSNALVNYLITNDLSAAGRSTAGDPTTKTERVADSFKDYTVSCNNYWGETLYKITLIVSDENSKGALGGSQDDYPDWQ
ncbi:MAG: hypothetical protein ACXVCP_16165 [Bdellovibrio sp.]